MSSSQESNGLGLDANTLVSNVDKSTRLRTQTELGKQYGFEMAMKHFNQSKLLLKKRLKEAESLNSENTSVNERQMKESQLRMELENLFTVYNKIGRLGYLEPHMLHSLELEVTEISKSYQFVETNLMNYERELNDDKRSECSLSTKSSSKHSSLSSASKHSSVLSKKLELSAKVARLGIKQKYHDSVVKAQAKLKKLEISKEIEATNAELDTFNKWDEDEMKPRSPLNLVLDENNEHTLGLMQQYLQDSRLMASSTVRSHSPLSNNEGLYNLEYSDKCYDNETDKQAVNDGVRLDPNANEFKPSKIDFLQTGKLGLGYGPDDCQADFNQIDRARLSQGTSLDTEFNYPVV